MANIKHSNEKKDQINGVYIVENFFIGNKSLLDILKKLLEQNIKFTEESN